MLFYKRTKMSLTLLAFMSATSVSVIATTSCEIGDGEICPTIISNQVTIADIKGDMEEVLQNVTAQLQKTSEEMKALTSLLNKESTEENEAANIQALRNCQTQNENKQTEVDELERKKKEAMQATEAKSSQQEQLRQDNEALKQKKIFLQRKMDCLMKEIEEQKGHIANLSVAAHIPVDCADLQIQGESENGGYTIYPYQTEESVEVQCDFHLDGGAWTTFLNRKPQDVPVKFDKTWNEFKKGFGNGSGEYWMGNDYLNALTSLDQTSMRIDATNFAGDQRFAEWNNFRVDNEENKYQLTMEGYQAESTLGDSLTIANKCYFTTFDNDNDPLDTYNCALGSRYSSIAPAGWWYHKCGLTRLTAPLVNTEEWDSALWTNWDHGVESVVSFKEFSLKIRRHNYKELAHVSA